MADNKNSFTVEGTDAQIQQRNEEIKTLEENLAKLRAEVKKLEKIKKILEGD